MVKKNHYDISYSKLKKYIDEDLKSYSKLRNFDFGPEKRRNVSNLSLFISHRIINEFEIIKEVLKKNNFSKVEKFIQEIFWRVYWKGWLENRPKVWNDFVNSLDSLHTNKNYKDACNGQTQIHCFNEWVKELKEKNYLHNHTRMWFASIWIFTLKLPWQLGAKFFLEHLYDGDAASNTLSWRWVAGLQTQGKHYLAKNWNIEKFTNNRFSNTKLNEEAVPIEEFTFYQIEKNILTYDYNEKNENLIIFENDLYFKDRIRFYKNYKKIFIIVLENEHRRIYIGKKVLSLKKELIKSFNSFFPNSEIIQNKDLINLLSSEKKIDIVYPFIGDNLDFISQCKKKFDLNLHFIYRNEDTFCWKYSKKGFFNFKSNIKNILKEFRLNE